MSDPVLPPVTDAHRHRALRLMAWHGWTLTQAMADPVRSRVLECCAAQLRTRDWQAQHARGTVLVRRLDPATGRWCTQRAAGDYTDQLTINPEETPT
jgi:hypothetical protein